VSSEVLIDSDDDDRDNHHRTGADECSISCASSSAYSMVSSGVVPADPEQPLDSYHSDDDDGVSKPAVVIKPTKSNDKSSAVRNAVLLIVALTLMVVLSTSFGALSHPPVLKEVLPVQETTVSTSPIVSYEAVPAINPVEDLGHFEELRSKEDDDAVAVDDVVAKGDTQLNAATTPTKKRRFSSWIRNIMNKLKNNRKIHQRARTGPLENPKGADNVNKLTALSML
jgi:hypothetical protein